ATRELDELMASLS
nr:Chain D, Paxillin [synthetic construct]1OW6_F Chain F, Paxillin [synthetic construct]1OW7_D Chain D, Paxillin [synthetic construct]1OW7_E Chain E, Paxillin [synthetic construct]1OW7_F Chain F, Paxillin [synthetic construct]3GM1_C Chain C, Paxillin [synthetic construct]3GM1_D Chain D, Paxillin [synthetic construct]3GM1_E Chain E, Paxillin [synthetic construct]3GM1_F Chain F, Paxillin [synthetic construct]3RQG_E Chain E, Paxillin LD4 peptide [Homo sapiens]